jgi:hypothetical protein
MTQGRQRVDTSGEHVRAAAARLGWTETERQPGSTSVTIRGEGPSSRLVAELGELLDAAAPADWTLARLEVGEGPEGRSSLVATFAGGRRVATARTAAISAVERRAAGRLVGRPPGIGPDLLERIGRARAAGRSYRQIAAELEADGVSPPGSASRWYASTLRAAELRRRRTG